MIGSILVCSVGVGGDFDGRIMKTGRLANFFAGKGGGVLFVFPFVCLRINTGPAAQGKGEDNKGPFK